jgi:hypothetical protein
VKRRKNQSIRPALELIEEAMHALRSAPVSALVAYVLGTAPFVAGMLFFWSDMSRSAFAEKHLVGGAIGLSVLFVWMKTWQAIFAAIVRAHVGREPAPQFSARVITRTVVRQLAIQPSSFVILPPLLIVLFGFGWFFAFYQNVVVLGARGDESLREFMKRCWRASTFAQTQNHAMLGIVKLFGLFVCLNIAIAMIQVPHLLKSFAGIESPFTLSAASALNTTFLAAVVALTYLCVDPLVKTIYVLRCFYAESRQSGEDLRVELRKFAVAAAVIVFLFAAPGTFGAESTASKPAAAVDAAELNRAIDETLRKPEYTWRAPRPKVEKTAKSNEESAFWNRIGEWLKSVGKSVDRWFTKVFRWRNSSTPSMPGFSLFSKEGLTYVLILLVAIIIGLLLYFLWRFKWKKRGAIAEAEAIAAPPNLADENVTAEQLPEDGWLRLGLEMIDRGELRLALRAFYLASLAHLAERDLITLAKFKSNRDYERELQRRSHALPELSATFSDNVSTFDRVWYGLHDVTSDLLERFRVNVERIKSC